MCFGRVSFDLVMTPTTHGQVFRCGATDDATALRPRQYLVDVDSDHLTSVVPSCFTESTLVEQVGNEQTAVDVQACHLCRPVSQWFADWSPRLFRP